MNADRGAAPARRERKRWGVRKRATATAVLVVAAALVVGGLVLLALLQASLRASTETSARRQAADVIAQISGQDVSEAAQYVVSTAHTGRYVQILGPGGAVFAASVPAAKSVPLTSLQPGPGQTLSEDVSGLRSVGDSDGYLVVASGVSVGGRPYTVVVAATVQVQADTLVTVAWLFVGATPLLLTVVGVSVWVLVGRSLRQVERIRGQVAGISARSLDGRVDVPPTADEIQSLAETMNMMLGRLQASNREQRRFVSDASHELRSPLATLSAGLEIAAADPSGATWQEMKTILAGETARMRYLVEDLLTLAKTNDGGLRLESIEVDLDDVLNEEVRRLRSTSARRIDVSLEPARVVGDPRRLGQVVRNVLDNAERHAVSIISIRVRDTDDGALITIDNDGPPVPGPDREKIFERFVRLDQSRSREGGGSGLGLAIAAAIMAAHHGWIRTGDAPDGGCRFELGFTRTVAGHPQDIAAAASDAGAPPGTGHGGPGQGAAPARSPA